MAKWMLDDYELRLSPTAFRDEYSSDGEVRMSTNGYTSASAHHLNNTIEMSITIYEDFTRLSKSPLVTVPLGMYVDIAMDNIFKYIYALRSDSAIIDIYNSSGALLGNIVAMDGSVSLPSGNPVSIAHTGFSIVLLYRDVNKIHIVRLSNGEASELRTIDETSGLGIADTVSMCWDNDTFLYLLNPYGRIYQYDLNRGTISLVYEFSEYYQNRDIGYKRYKSIGAYLPSNSVYLMVMRDDSSIIFIGDSGIVQIESFDNRTCMAIASIGDRDNFAVLTDKSIRNASINCSTVDLDVIRRKLRNGYIIITNEHGAKKMVNIRTFRVVRKKRRSSSVYDIDIQADVMGYGIGFGNNWILY